MSKETNFDFESMKDKALKQLRSGKSLYGKEADCVLGLKGNQSALLEEVQDDFLFS